jgi:hypothetical protein
MSAFQLRNPLYRLTRQATSRQERGTLALGVPNLCTEVVPYILLRTASGAGGLIATNNREYYDRLLEWLPVYEGFATYGGMSTKEIEAMAVGMREMMDTNVAGSSAEFVKYFVGRMRALDGWGARLADAFRADFGDAM